MIPGTRRTWESGRSVEWKSLPGGTGRITFHGEEGSGDGVYEDDHDGKDRVEVKN